MSASQDTVEVVPSYRLTAILRGRRPAVPSQPWLSRGRTAGSGGALVHPGCGAELRGNVGRGA